jgi:hypothetical protein
MGVAMGEKGIPTLTARAYGMRERPVIYLVDFPQGQRAQINQEYTRRNSGRGLSCFFSAVQPKSPMRAIEPSYREHDMGQPRRKGPPCPNDCLFPPAA